ncbi:aldehyde dehydrogenase family protein [Humisphaera borealis]|uniref:Aldehyde dehydrogenase family protein n=1 Tax=Humisphaera borealis TaxID=2807512 RepID=A0A7M2WRA9_9BACT|nr:aldehyde dehydrogenase family protein [Humisphaera borealis]QOV88048.1 aldehyde dehydrogenase family protein [Humisphaera borealis]
MLHIPILRHGKPYESVDKTTIVHHATGEPVAQVSQANSGLISRDIHRMNYDVLEQFKVKELISMYKKAAEIFISGTVLIGDQKQDFDGYINTLSSTTGMPQTYCRTNAKKIHRTMDEVDQIIAGLTRGFDLSILDRGFGDDDGRMLSWYREAKTFGAILPSNSPGVHSLWIPAIALKTPIVLKPGREEPWSPLRIIQSFIAAGFPPEAFGFYPTDHGGSGVILSTVDRAMLFGDAGTTKMWAHDPRIELHGPGWSKVILGPDAAENWEQYVDLIAASIAANGGRSCINASAVYTPKNADKIAHAVAAKLAKVKALPANDPAAEVAAFANPTMAERMNGAIDAGLHIEGAKDVTQEIRGTPRLVKDGRLAWLLPTIIRCDKDHPLATKEYLFPFAAVIECPAEEIPEAIGQTLVGTVVSKDKKFIRACMAAGHIDRLNIGPIETFKLSWDQPHEGNLFNLLYRQRAFQLNLAEAELAAAFS